MQQRFPSERIYEPLCLFQRFPQSTIRRIIVEKLHVAVDKQENSELQTLSQDHSQLDGECSQSSPWYRFCSNQLMESILLTTFAWKSVKANYIFFWGPNDIKQFFPQCSTHAEEVAREPDPTREMGKTMKGSSHWDADLLRCRFDSFQRKSQRSPCS